MPRFRVKPLVIVLEYTRHDLEEQTEMAKQEPQNSFEHGPYIQLATFCERVLREADGVISLVRVIDVINHTARGPNAPRDMPEVRYPLMLVITIKSGKTRGRHDVRIVPEMPSGETMPSVTISVQMEGEHRGVNLVNELDIPYKLEGLYWFNVYFDDRLFTRIPLQVQYSRLAAGLTTTSPQ